MANITVDIKKKSIDIGSNLVAIGKGGMSPGVYDPQEIKADVFDMDNMVDGIDKHYLTTEQMEEFENKQDALTAGDNIDITNNVISATDTTYTAGDGISIDENNVISNTRVSAEWGNIEGNIEDQTDLQDALADKQDIISDLSEIRSNATAGKNASDTIATYGDIVTHDADEFATVEQGSKAETALQPNDNISELTNDVGYITNAYHDNTKQDVINDLETIRSGAALGTTAIQPNDNISELTNDVGYITNAYHDNTKQDTLVAGDNIQIAADGKTISATDTTYTAGQGISIDANNVISNTQTSAEWGNIQGDIEDQTDLQSALADKQDVISDLSEIRSNASAGKDASDTIATYGDIVTHDADEFATADSVGEGVLTIQKNSTTVDTFSANATENKTINITVPTQASDVGALPDTTKYAANLDLSINSSTYVVTAQLKDQDGNNIGNQRTIDLPLESVVVSGSYDSATKEVVLTLEGGSTIRFSVADLVSGLQTEITSTNKLDADLVDDSTSTNKFVTAADLTKLSNTSGVNTGDQSASDFDIKDLADTTGLRSTWSGKQDVINDLNTIRDNASAGKAASDTIATYGDVVTHDADEFATSAQGAKADTALQSGDDISELNNDVGYVTSSYHDNTKQDVISDLETIRSGAGLGVTAVQPEDIEDYMAYPDFNFTTVTGDSVALGLATEITPSGDFTVNAPSEIEDGQTYILRVNNGATPVGMTLGDGIVNVHGVSTTLTANATDMFVFLAVSNTLELQPEMPSSMEWGNITGTLTNQTDLQTALDTKQDKSNMVTTLTGADDNHYPTAKAVADAITSSGGGDMLKATYDPNSVEGDVFDMDNMIDGTDKHYITTIQQTILNNTSGINTGDQSASDFDIKDLADTTNLKAEWSGKQDAISDLNTIRSNATAGAGAATTIAGYGDVVTHNTDEFATAAQGDKADSSLQSGDDISELNNDIGYVTSSYHDSSKQDTINDLSTIRSGAGLGATAIQPNDNVSELTNDAGYITNSYHDNTKQDVLIAGDNISIALDGKTISATGDMAYADFNFVTLTGTTLILGLSNAITPTANFTVNAPSTIQDGQTYVLRVNNGATAYTMTLGTNVTNPSGVDISLSAGNIDQFIFLAIGGNLELQDTALSGSVKYGASFDLSLNTTTYVLTATLKDQDGNTLGTAQTIDLPLESVVVSGSYNDTTKKIILTLQSGSTVEFSVADLVSGLQSEITSTNKLSSDLVDDTNHTNKFVTASEKSTWNGKQNAINNNNKLSADYISNGTNNRVCVVGATAPSTPSEGDLWYDTTNDKLKTYDGSQWNESGGGGGGEGNTKTFHMQSNYWDIATVGAQIASWLSEGQTLDVSTFKDAIILCGVYVYERLDEYIEYSGNYRISFMMREPTSVRNSDGTSSGKFKLIRFLFSYNNGTWTYVSHDITQDVIIVNNYLRTDYNYSTPYTPLYNGSPATKKYVDDSVSVVSGDSGVTYTIKVSNSDPATGTASNIITLVM